MASRALLVRVLPTLAAVTFTALFTALGFWQLGRAEFKDRLWRDYSRSQDETPVRVSAVAGLDGLARYRRVEITGRFDARRQVYLDNRIRDGRPGVHVFTPLRLDGGVVLVNRGWLPMPPDRRTLPAAPTPEGKVTVTGRAAPPPATGLELGRVGAPATWPWLTPYLDLDAVASALERPVAARVVLLDPESPFGFARNWEPATLPPQRHIGYAVQWFALAGAVTVVWLVLTLRAGRGLGKSRST